jgi:hypothetical protein
MILYHIMADTGCLPDDVVPQIPTNRMKGEDQEIPRICLGHTLDDCLTSIGIAHFVSKFLLAELRQNKKTLQGHAVTVHCPNVQHQGRRPESLDRGRNTEICGGFCRDQ